MTICACVPWEQLDEKKNGQEREIKRKRESVESVKRSVETFLVVKRVFVVR